MNARSPNLTIKRVFEPPDPGDGTLVLVDGLWPRGLNKTRARVALWLRELAPTAALRKWFNHDPTKWEAFRRRYKAELNAHPEAVRRLSDLVRSGPVTLLYAAKDERERDALAGDGTRTPIVPTSATAHSATSIFGGRADAGVGAARRQSCFVSRLTARVKPAWVRGEDSDYRD